MNSMQNAILGIFSFGFYTVLAIYQTTLTSEFAIIKDLGMGGAFIATCFFMFRYFTKQIEDKDKEQKELTEKFMEIAQKAIERETQGNQINQQVISLMSKFNGDSHDERKRTERR